MKTATIPHLNSFRNLLPRGNVSADVLNATEEQLAKMSEATLASLSDRVQQIASATVESPTPVAASEKDTRPTDRFVGEAIRNVVNQILERSSPSVPMVLLFVGSEPNHHVDELSARIATALCDTTESRVLLVDSDNVGKKLTNASGRLKESGMTEVIEYNRDWQTNLLRNTRSNLDFLPVGNGSFGRWNQEELLRKAARGMKTDYQFVCVSAGDAHSKAAKLWSDVCDGSYLLVSIENSNGTIAKSAVAELKASGARLLGCIATDVHEA